MSSTAGALNVDSPTAQAFGAAAILESTTNSLRVKFTYLLIRLAGAAALPLLLLYAAWRCTRQAAYFNGMTERLGWLPANIPSTRPGGIWLHAVSVGEVVSIVPLLKSLRGALPDTPIFVSTTTLTGRALAESKLVGLCDGVFFAPVDFPFAIRRVLRRLTPALVINLETEIWPNWLREAKRSGAQWAQVNARISDKAWPRYQKWQWVFASILPQIDFLAAQSEVDAARFRSLGYDRDIAMLGNLKFDFEPNATSAPADIVAWFAAQAPKPLWAAASTTAVDEVDEDDAVLDAFAALEGRVRLLLAPRRPERFAIVADKLRERRIPFGQRTRLGECAAADVLLLDSIGELAGLFPLADVVFVGGTFNATEGHNILEPASFGKPIITGPRMGNFAEIQSRFRGIVTELARPEELAAAVARLIADDGGAGRRGEEMAASMRGVAARLTPPLVEFYGEGVPKGLLPLSSVLRPFSAPWVWVSQRSVESRRLPVPVVSVGNLSMGGTGKTPMVLALAELYAHQGKRVGILTRGYGRAATRDVLIGPGGEDMPTRAETGDEAQLFIRAGDYAVGIGGDRYEVGKALLERYPVDLLLLDDGFQHRRLARDFDLVCVDALRPFPGWNVLPAGLLREPIEALRRASAVAITRGRRGVVYSGLAGVLGKPPFVVTTSETLDELPKHGSRIAFCGLGNPASFRQSLDAIGLRDVELVTFPDHHEYSARDLADLRERGDLWITTAKDAVKLGDSAGYFVLRQSTVLGQDLSHTMLRLL